MENNNNNKSNSNDELSELKDAAGAFAKAAGGFLGAAGKLAAKKGEELKDKLSDEDFQNQIKSNVKTSAKVVTETASKTADIIAESVKKTVDNVAEAVETKNQESLYETFVDSDEIADIGDNQEIPDKSVILEMPEIHENEYSVIDEANDYEDIADTHLKKVTIIDAKKKDSSIIAIVGVFLLIVLLGAMSLRSNKTGKTMTIEKIAMPSVEKLSVGKAITAITDAGFSENQIEFYDSDDHEILIKEPDKKWSVVTQNPVAEEEISDNDKILLYVDDNTVNEKDLKTFIGKRCNKADSEIKKLGVKPIYIASNTQQDMTSPIQNDEETAKMFKIIKLNKYNRKTGKAEFTVKSKLVEKQEKKNKIARSKMSDIDAFNAVRDYGRSLEYTFNIRLSSTAMKLIDGKWHVYGECTFENVYGKKEKMEFVATVSGSRDDPEIEEFEIR